MSKSLKRVKAALISMGGNQKTILETTLARTANDAAKAIGCEVDQIAKSIIFRGATSHKLFLFITAGGNQVAPNKAEKLAREPLEKADAGVIRSQTGFAIGGVSPVGHLNPITTFMDKRLAEFATIWAAAGTPHHVFECSPVELMKYCDAQLHDFTTK